MTSTILAQTLSRLRPAAPCAKFLRRNFQNSSQSFGPGPT
jgi:hypothetical protein